jgi:hypothetical protein
MAKRKQVGECRLCSFEKDLRDSHYLPKRLYAFLRAWQLENPNPVMSIGNELKQISDQYRAHLFCQDCEDLLNKNGEKWVLANVPKDYDADFPLHTAINKLTPKFAGQNYVLCNVSGEADFNVDQLVYFGLSVFWRGAVHDWKTSTGQSAPKVDLGIYAQPIREFLLGKVPLADDVVLTLDIWPYTKVLQMLYPVLPNHLPECQRYWFYVPGLHYALYLGRNIPKGARSRSASDGFVAVDQKAADSVLAYTKRGVKSQHIGPRIEEMHHAAEVRSKTPTKK